MLYNFKNNWNDDVILFLIIATGKQFLINFFDFDVAWYFIAFHQFLDDWYNPWLIFQSHKWNVVEHVSHTPVSIHEFPNYIILLFRRISIFGSSAIEIIVFNNLHMCLPKSRSIFLGKKYARCTTIIYFFLFSVGQNSVGLVYNGEFIACNSFIFITNTVRVVFPC